MKNTFNLYNCLDTIAVCLSMGMDNTVAEEVIKYYDVTIEELLEFKEEYCFGVFEDNEIIKLDKNGEWQFAWESGLDDNK